MLYDGCTVSRKQCKKLILKEDDCTNRPSTFVQSSMTVQARDGCAIMADYVTTCMTMSLTRLYRVCLWRRRADATLERFRRERTMRFWRLWITSNVKFLKQSHGFVGKQTTDGLIRRTARAIVRARPTPSVVHVEHGAVTAKLVVCAPVHLSLIHISEPTRPY